MKFRAFQSLRVGGFEDKRVPFLRVYLDFLRFSAALLVVFGHSRLHAFGKTRSSELGVDLLGASIALLTSFAHAAVIVFFVVSGFLVGGKLINSHRIDKQYLKNYFIDRASRIYTVSIPAIFFSFFLAIFLTQIYGQSYTLTKSVCNPSPFDLVATTFFLHAGFWKGHACNGPFWSLDYEVFYYVWFAALSAALLSVSRKMQLIALLSFLAIGAYGLGEPSLRMVGYSSLWALGGLVAASHITSFIRAAYLVVLLTLLTYCVSVNVKEVWQDAFIGVVTCASLMIAKKIDRRGFVVPSNIAAILAGGAAISYSMYLFHAPTINAIRTISEMGFGVNLAASEVNGSSLLVFAILSSAAIVSGVGGWYLFERHTNLIRKRMKSVFVEQNLYAGSK